MKERKQPTVTILQQAIFYFLFFFNFLTILLEWH